MDSTQNIVPVTPSSVPVIPNTQPPATVTSDTEVAKSSIEKLTDKVVEAEGNIFDMLSEEEKYQAQIRSYILANLDKFEPREVIGLITSATTNKNDLVSKSTAPLIQLLTAAQQNEAAERKERQKEQENKSNITNITQLNTVAPMEVLQGLMGLFNMGNAAAPLPPKSAEVIDVKDAN